MAKEPTKKKLAYSEGDDRMHSDFQDTQEGLEYVVYPMFLGSVH